MFFRWSVKRLLVLMLFVSLMISGCSKITLENYDRLKVGMSYAEVTAVMGAADECSEKMGIKSCTWGTEKKHITVKFVADHAVYFSSKGL